MKKLFIYYSLNGNGDIVANYLKENKFDVRRVIMKDKMPKSYIGQIFTGGFLAGINYKAKIDNFDYNIDAYDEIIIGSPIWNGKLSCPINTILNKTIFTNKKVTFILWSGSGSAPKAEKMIKDKYNEVNIIMLKEPKNNIDEMKNNLKQII